MKSSRPLEPYRAIIDPPKLHSYLLSPSHPIGRFKCAFFSALGYSAADWRALDQALRQQHLGEDAQIGKNDDHGQRYEIRAILRGPAGSSAPVVSIWNIRTGETVPRFVTAYPGVES